MMLFTLALMLFTVQQANGLALVALSVRAANLWGRTRQRTSPPTPVLYANTEPMNSMVEPTSTEASTRFDSESVIDMSDYRSEMLNLVYERNMNRLMQ